MLMRQYETIVIVDPDAGQEGTDKVLERMRDGLSKTEGREVRLEDWGRRKLAYDIGKHNKAHYLYLNYLGTGTTVAEVERLLRVTEPALKFHTVLLGIRVESDSFDFAQAAATITPWQRPRAPGQAEPNYDGILADRRDNEDDDDDDDT
jgi:small subunit ribosomal protein S6